MKGREEFPREGILIRTPKKLKTSVRQAQTNCFRNHEKVAARGLGMLIVGAETKLTY